MEIEQETSRRLDGNRYTTGDYTLWLDQQELDALVDVLVETMAPIEEEILEELASKLERYYKIEVDTKITDRS